MTRDDGNTLSLDRYAPDAKALVAGAQTLADERKHVEVQPLHLLVRGLTRDPGVAAVFEHAGVAALPLQSAAEKALAELPRGREPAYLSAAMIDLLERAEREAKRERAKVVGVEHLLNALSQEIRGPAGEVLFAFGVTPGALRAHVRVLRDVPRPTRGGGPDASVLGEVTRDLVAAARADRLDPVVGRDGEVRRLLTILERRQKQHPLLVGEAGVGRGAIISALARRLAGGDVPTSLAGARLLELDIGAIIAGARLRGEVEERVRKLLGMVTREGENAILVVRGVEQLFGSGAAGNGVGDVLRPALQRGELRLLGTTTPEGVRRLADRDPNVLRAFTRLDIDEPSVDAAVEILRGIATRYERHHGVRVSEGAIVTAVRLAKRYLQDRFLPDSAIDLLDEAAAAKRVELDGTPASVDEVIRRLESLEAQLASLEPAGDEATAEVRERLAREVTELRPRVAELRQQIEARRGIVAAVRALRGELAETRRQCDQARDEKAFGRVGELEHVTIPELEQRLARAEEAARGAGATEGAAVLGEADVALTLAGFTGIPVQKMLEAEAAKLLEMEERLGARVVGQGEALRAVARAVRRGRVGLRDPGKPIGSFLFLGPSGVGKTELAKALAEFLFDDEQALTRLDMSEFMERHMAQRLIGAPPGYADSEQGGFLTEAVRRRPYSVLLFDEVEKAHQDVFNLLLQVLDDGRLTDGRGRLADFSNTVVVMTSNTGSGRILETEPKLFESEDGREALRDVLLDELHRFFRPEFLNRVDDVVVFRPLTRDHLRSIVSIQLARLEGLLEDRRIRLILTESAKDRLVELGYDPALGARPLRRELSRRVQDPLAEALLAGRVANGATVTVELSGEEFVLSA
ncbi:MAG: AAA family ATPase [Polyangiaceae bacterium]|nr:AAA family ATPase [Polyangiaceae bacterium]